METNMIPDEENLFKSFVEAIPQKDYPQIRRKIIDKCQITGQIYINWKNGYSRVAKLAKPIINAIASDYYGEPMDIFSEENKQQMVEQ